MGPIRTVSVHGHTGILRDVAVLDLAEALELLFLYFPGRTLGQPFGSKLSAKGANMFSRLITCTIDPAKVNDFRNALNNQFLPRIQALPGFMDNIESLDPATGQFSCMTLWKTKSDVENYDNGLFKEVAAGLTPLMQGNPAVQTLPVENSSMHHVKAGSAAA